MRTLLLLALIAACSSSPKRSPAAPEPGPAAPPEDPIPAAPAVPAAVPETLAEDTPKTTTAGNTFVAPKGWTLSVRGDATILGAPEGNTWIALVDVRAADAEAALAAAWAAYKPGGKAPPVKVAHDQPPKNGWTDQKVFAYELPPNDKRALQAGAARANGAWTVVIIDAAQAVAEKRISEIVTVFERLLPKGGARESFAGKQAHELDAARVGELTTFVQSAQKLLDVPGVGLGLVQGGKVVFAGGFGVRELGKPAKVDRDTLFMIGSNTKALTTLLFAKLVDAKQLAWDTPVTSVMPAFKLGDEATTKSVQVKHLICACTGLPRQDLEWIFEYKGVTPAAVVTALGAMQPTSKFGEMFQYSNLLAAVAGYVAAYAVNPKLELGASYDRAMQAMVFDPLGMKATTFDYARALRGNVSRPHGADIDGKPGVMPFDMNYSIVPVRPAGAAWSSVSDLLTYVQMELAEGQLPGGKRYIAKDVLLARRAPQVSVGKDSTYGMGLSVDTGNGTTIVDHGGATFGYHSQMLWLPEHGVGAVILTNGELGQALLGQFQRKLLEVLFDGKPEADAAVASTAKNVVAQRAADRKLLVVPADPAEVAKLAPAYHNAALGDLTVQKVDAATVFDMGEWKVEVATRANADGTRSFVSIGTGLIGLNFTAGADAAGKRTLTIRDAQHEYVFEAKP